MPHILHNLTESFPAGDVTVQPVNLTEKSRPVYAKVTGTFLVNDALSLNNPLYPAETVERVVKRSPGAHWPDR